jgi:uncharacterized protein
MNCRSFQRLRNVRQLGLAHFVYPGADYSRFSHAVGACHLAGRMAGAILRRRKKSIGDKEVEEIQRFRLAGLLHDIGHYPFSHATQDAIENFCASKKIKGFAHENLGGKILELDDELRTALTTHDINPDAISSIFERTDPKQKLSNIISSDLDADRLDYLPRTAHFSGLPHGGIDRDYLISQLCEDRDGTPALTYKALRAADAFLISRLMDYRQVAYHKTVAAFEWLLKDVIKAVLALPGCDLNVSKAGIEQMIQSGKWADFTDDDLMARINRELSGKRKFGNESTARQAEAIIRRHPPTMVAEVEQFVELRETPEEGSPEQGTDGYNLAIQRVETYIEKWAKDFSVDPQLWHVWSMRVRLTKMGSHIPVSDRFKPANPKDQDRYGQMIRLAEPGKKSKLLTEVPQALCHLLANFNLEIIRVYVLLPQNRRNERDKIAARIRSDVSSAGWTG